MATETEQLADLMFSLLHQHHADIEALKSENSALKAANATLQQTLNDICKGVSERLDAIDNHLAEQPDEYALHRFFNPNVGRDSDDPQRAGSLT